MKHHAASATEAVASACTLSVVMLCACFGLCLVQGWWTSSGICLDASRWAASLGLLLLSTCCFSLGIAVWRQVTGRHPAGITRTRGALALSLALLFLVPTTLLLRACLR